MTPDRVKACSFWEFQVAIAGWSAAHASDDKGGLSAQDEESLWQGVMDRMH